MSIAECAEMHSWGQKCTVGDKISEEAPHPRKSGQKISQEATSPRKAGQNLTRRDPSAEIRYKTSQEAAHPRKFGQNQTKKMFCLLLVGYCWLAPTSCAEASCGA